MFWIRTVESGSMCWTRNQICVPNQNMMYTPTLDQRVGSAPYGVPSTYFTTAFAHTNQAYFPFDMVEQVQNNKTTTQCSAERVIFWSRRRPHHPVRVF